jgi:CBS domain containing-hemolysin-like protein
LISNTLVPIVLTSTALAGSAFFSAAETALFSIPRERIFFFQKNPEKNYLRIYSLLKNGQQTLLMILLGNIFVNITLTGLINTILSKLFFIHAELVTLSVATVIIVLFGEIIPKNFALKHNEFVARIVAQPLLLFIKICTPFLRTIQNINQIFLSGFKIHLREPEPFVTINELKSGVAKSVLSGAILQEEASIINRILEQGSIPARKYMIHRSKLLVVGEIAHVNTVIESMQKQQNQIALIQSKNRSLYITGIVRLSSLISAPDTSEVGNFAENPIWAPESSEVAELIGFLLENKRNEACLLDEYGGFSGLFSVTDAIFSFFGDIFQESFESCLNTKSITLRGSMELDSITGYLPQNLLNQTSNYRTVNGLLTNYLGRIPKTGETFAIGECKFYILSSTPTKIDQVLIQKGDNNDC